MKEKTLLKEILVPQIYLQFMGEKIFNKTGLNVFGILSRIPKDGLNFIYDSMLSLWSKYPLSIYYPNPKFNGQLFIKGADRVCEIKFNTTIKKIDETNYTRYIGQKILPYKIEFDNNKTYVFDLVIEKHNEFMGANTDTYYITTLSDIAIILIRYFGINAPELKGNVFSKAFPNGYIPPSNIYYSKHEHIDEQIGFMYIKKFFENIYKVIPNIVIIIYDHQFKNFEYELHILKDLNITFLVISSEDRNTFNTIIDLNTYFESEYYKNKLKNLIKEETHLNPLDIETKLDNKDFTLLDYLLDLKSLELVCKIIRSYNIQIASYLYCENTKTKKVDNLNLKKEKYFKYLINKINYTKTNNPFI